MTEIRFNLDDEIYADVLAEIQAIAPSKSLGKIMPKILLEWYYGKLPKNSQENGSNLGDSREIVGNNDIAIALSELKFE